MRLTIMATTVLLAVLLFEMASSQIVPCSYRYCRITVNGSVNGQGDSTSSFMVSWDENHLHAQPNDNSMDLMADANDPKVENVVGAGTVTFCDDYTSNTFNIFLNTMLVYQVAVQDPRPLCSNMAILAK